MYPLAARLSIAIPFIFVGLAWVEGTNTFLLDDARLSLSQALSGVHGIKPLLYRRNTTRIGVTRTTKIMVVSFIANLP